MNPEGEVQEPTTQNALSKGIVLVSAVTTCHTCKLKNTHLLSHGYGGLSGLQVLLG